VSSSACSCWRDGGARHERVQLSGGSRVGIRGRSDRKKVSKRNRVRPQRVPTALAVGSGVCHDCGDAGSQGPAGSKNPGRLSPGVLLCDMPPANESTKLVPAVLHCTVALHSAAVFLEIVN